VLSKTRVVSCDAYVAAPRAGAGLNSPDHARWIIAEPGQCRQFGGASSAAEILITRRYTSINATDARDDADVLPNENPRGDRDETAEPRGCIFTRPRATQVAGRGVHDQRVVRGAARAVMAGRKPSQYSGRWDNEKALIESAAKRPTASLRRSRPAVRAG